MSTSAIVRGGTRREINIQCPSCNHQSQVPPAAVIRNNFYCAGCGKSIDLSQVFRQLAGGEGPGPIQRGGSDKRESRYKSARKGRR
ncbi:MAG TPA: hypothetical protein VM490_16110 [Armatimonadaceae bacterium]|jgi:hypothetical protein|nr:hypothetical protein [Armatimonadaceae bacterium]